MNTSLYCMQRQMLRIFALAVVLLSTACSSVIDGLPERSRAPAELSVFKYYDWAQGATSSALAEERARLRTLIPDAAIATVQLAILLSVAYEEDASAQNEALSLLAAMTPAPSTWYETRRQDYLDFAAIWREVLQKRTTRQAGAGDEAALLQRIQELEAQIDALTAIEQQLIDRERTR